MTDIGIFTPLVAGELMFAVRQARLPPKVGLVVWVGLRVYFRSAVTRAAFVPRRRSPPASLPSGGNGGLAGRLALCSRGYCRNKSG